MKFSFISMIFGEKAPNDQNVILTGLPRAGTTLVCHLLNKLPDVVALHEPLNPNRMGEEKSAADRRRHILKFFQKSRNSIRSSGKVVSKQINGEVPDNPASARFGSDGLRASIVQRGMISIDKPFSEDGLLVMKHNAIFAAILEELREDFKVFAVIRNPMSTLASWNTVRMPINDGWVPAGQRLNAELNKDLIRIKGVLDRQLFLLKWFFQRFLDCVPEKHIIHYEELIASKGKALDVITEKAGDLDVPLTNKNRNEIYDYQKMKAWAERLLKEDGAFWHFYSKEDVRNLMDG